MRGSSHGVQNRRKCRERWIAIRGPDDRHKKGPASRQSLPGAGIRHPDAVKSGPGRQDAFWTLPALRHRVQIRTRKVRPFSRIRTR